MLLLLALVCWLKWSISFAFLPNRLFLPLV